MFYQRLLGLCEKRNVRVTNVIAELGLSSGNLSKWKSGAVPKADTIKALADYFNVSIDYLMGSTAHNADELDGVEFALFGEIQTMTDAEKQDILDYIRFKKVQRKP